MNVEKSLNKSINKLQASLEMQARHYVRLRLFWEGALIGLSTGLVIGFFRYALAMTEVYRPIVYDYVKVSPEILPLYIIFFIVAGWLLSIISCREPMCGGSGIPQLKGVLAGSMEWNWLSVLLHKVIGGILAIGAGMSLGREGPSVQIGSCVGHGYSELWHRSRSELRLLLTAGAGAGLAAAFNAPLAGVIFCLEELRGTVSPYLLVSSMGAAVISVGVITLIFGDATVFTVDKLEVMPIADYWLLALLGLFIGVMARFFNPCLFFFMNLYGKYIKNGLIKVLIPLAMAGVLGFVLPDILGGGSGLVDKMIELDFSLEMLVILYLGKFIFTMVCFGSGVPGGIFLPMLVMGAGVGAIFGNVAVSEHLLPALMEPNMVVFGMAAYFAAVTKSPITGSVLIMEMTGSFSHMLALICVCMVAYMVSDLTGGQPVYDQLLNRSLRLKAEKLKATSA